MFEWTNTTKHFAFLLMLHCKYNQMWFQALTFILNNFHAIMYGAPSSGLSGFIWKAQQINTNKETQISASWFCAFKEAFCPVRLCNHLRALGDNRPKICSHFMYVTNGIGLFSPVPLLWCYGAGSWSWTDAHGAESCTRLFQDWNAIVLIL